MTLTSIVFQILYGLVVITGKSQKALLLRLKQKFLRRCNRRKGAWSKHNFSKSVEKKTIKIHYVFEHAPGISDFNPELLYCRF